MGNSQPGLTPHAAYTIDFPAEMPMPLTPWSPSPAATVRARHALVVSQ